MKKNFSSCLVFTALFAFGALPAQDGDAQAEAPHKKVALSIPFSGAVATPKVFIVSRALDYAREIGADAVIINMDTPGGDLGSTLKLMELVGGFEGDSFCYVNKEAMSAGSYIAIAAKRIWFAPDGIMGAAEAVSGTGSDIDESMQRKISSFMGAKIRVHGKDNEFRKRVQRAMMDPNYVLEIDGQVLKKEGELLSLTAAEAVKKYGGENLLADGIARDENDLLNQAYGAGNYELVKFDIALFEKISEFIQLISPLLIGIGILLVMMELKSSSFGVMGAVGVGLVLCVFAGTYLAGLSGHEEVVLFALGLVILCIDVFYLGWMFPALLGGALMLFSVALALSGLLKTFHFDGTETLDFSALIGALTKVGIGVFIALGLFWILSKILPRFGFWRTLIPVQSYDTSALSNEEAACVGSSAVALTDLSPSGKIEFNGKIADASSELSAIERGSLVEIVGRRDFYWLVKRKGP